MAKNLSNLIVPSVFGGYVAAGLAKSNAFIKSGAAVLSPQLSALLSGGAAQFNLPYWKNLSSTGIIPSTDADTAAGTQRMAAGNQIALRILRAVTPVAVTDLEGMLIGEDPVGEAVKQFVEMHNTIRQSVVIGMLNAVTAVDSADGGTDADLLFTSAATSGSIDLVAEAIATVWGDSVRGLGGLTLVMNSLEYLDFQKKQTAAPGVAVANAVDVGFGTVAGATIIVDDDVAANTIMVLRPGGLAFGASSVAVPFEMERKAGAGNGGGADILYSRDLFSYHVAGTSFTGTYTSGEELATDADIAASAKWSLVRDKKYCGVLKITHA